MIWIVKFWDGKCVGATQALNDDLDIAFERAKRLASLSTFKRSDNWFSVSFDKLTEVTIIVPEDEVPWAPSPIFAAIEFAIRAAYYALGIR